MAGSIWICDHAEADEGGRRRAEDLKAALAPG